MPCAAETVALGALTILSVRGVGLRACAPHRARAGTSPRCELLQVPHPAFEVVGQGSGWRMRATVSCRV